MIGLSVINDGGYFFNLSHSSGHATEYYSEKNQSPGTWQGTYADKLGLTGKPVNSNDFDSLANQTQGNAQGVHRLALNVSYSAPKSVSIAYLVLKDERIRAVHERAVVVANKHLESNLALTRQGKGGAEIVEVSGVAVANFTHLRNRENEPNLHTHSAVINAVVRQSDGKITTLDASEIYKNQKALDQIYKNELASQCQKLGYRVEMVDAHGNFKIVGVPDKLCAAMSTRQQQIEAAMPGLRVKFPGAHESALREIAAKESRTPKQLMTSEKLVTRDEQIVKSLGLSVEKIKADIKAGIKKVASPSEQKIEYYLREASKILQENESAYSKTALYSAAGKLSLSQAEVEKVVTLAQLDKAYDHLVWKGYFLSCGYHKITTAEMRGMENSIIKYANQGKNTTTAYVKNGIALEKIIKNYEADKGYKLTQGQRDAVAYVLTSRDAVVGIQGNAGAGKTAALELIGRQLAGQSVVTRGLAPTGKAAEEMSRTLGSGQTVDSLLATIKKGNFVVTKNPEKYNKKYDKLNQIFEKQKWGKKKNLTLGTAQSELQNMATAVVGGKSPCQSYMDSSGGKTIIFPRRNVFGLRQNNAVEILHKAANGTISRTVSTIWLPGSKLDFVKSSTSKTYQPASRVFSQGREVWVVDESSMLSSHKAAELVNTSQQVGARIIIMGDSKQLVAVGAGKIFSDLQQRGMNTAQMTESIRQQTPEYKSMVDALSRKDYAAALDKMQSHICTYPQGQGMQAGIIRDYISSKGNVLIVAASNREKNALNSAIRQELKACGKLAGVEYSHNTLTSKNLSGEAKRYSYNYAEGDKIHMSYKAAQAAGLPKGNNEYTVTVTDPLRNTITLQSTSGTLHTMDTRQHGGNMSIYQPEQREFTKGDKIIALKNDKQLGVKNGEMFKVQSIDESGNITLKNDNGQKTINIKQYNYIDHGYASTIHKSQGATVNKVIYSHTSHSNYNQIYTAVTRGKSDYSIHSNDAVKLATEMKQEQQKETSLWGKADVEISSSRQSLQAVDSSHAVDHGEDRVPSSLSIQQDDTGRGR